MSSPAREPTTLDFRAVDVVAPSPAPSRPASRPPTRSGGGGGGGARRSIGDGNVDDDGDIDNDDIEALRSRLAEVTSERDDLARDVESLCVQMGGSGSSSSSSAAGASAAALPLSATLSALSSTLTAAAKRGPGGLTFSHSAVVTGKLRELEAEASKLRAQLQATTRDKQSIEEDLSAVKAAARGRAAAVVPCKT